MTNFKLKIASRRSKLAMVQTLWVKDQLERNIPNLEVSIEAMATQGDKILDVALAKIGDKGLFTKELEAQMLVGHADIAVHSLKDLPTNLPNGLKLGCITKREDPADALVVNKKNDCYKLENLPEGSIVGTSSLRRLAQLRNKYPHLVFKDIRGNVITRIEKLDAGEFDCIILAAAGLKRLGFESRIHQIIPSKIQNEQLCLTGMVASLDGERLIKDQYIGNINDPEEVGKELAKKLKQQGAEEILSEIFEKFREK